MEEGFTGHFLKAYLVVDEGNAKQVTLVVKTGLDCEWSEWQ